MLVITGLRLLYLWLPIRKKETGQAAESAAYFPLYGISDKQEQRQNHGENSFRR